MANVPNEELAGESVMDAYDRKAGKYTSSWGGKTDIPDPLQKQSVAPPIAPAQGMPPVLNIPTPFKLKG